MALNRITETLDVHQQRADIPTEEASVLKALFDQDVNTVKDVYNTLIDQLEDKLGSGMLGATKLSDGSSLSDIQTELEYLLAELQGISQGAVADGSITDVKLTNDTDATKDKVSSLSGVIEPDSIVSQLISVTVAPSVNIFTLKISTDVTGGTITISKNGGSAKTLKEPDGTEVTELLAEDKYFQIIEEAGEYVMLSGAGFNPLKYTNECDSGNISNPGEIDNGGGISVLSVTGRGILNAALFGANVSSQIRILIDGVAYDKIGGTTSSACCGIANSDIASVSNSTSQPYININGTGYYGYARDKSSTSHVFYTAVPIEFKTSLEVVVGTIAGTSNSGNYRIDYALKG